MSAAASMFFECMLKNYSAHELDYEHQSCTAARDLKVFAQGDIIVIQCLAAPQNNQRWRVMSTHYTVLYTLTADINK